eukprot:6531493-Lingulodinium_polyedra.AAC.1
MHVACCACAFWFHFTHHALVHSCCSQDCALSARLLAAMDPVELPLYSRDQPGAALSAAVRAVIGWRRLLRRIRRIRRLQRIWAHLG